jgi:hypothetical protein
MKKTILLLTLLLLIAFISYGQKGYYKKDTCMFLGVKMISGGNKLNSRLCQIDTEKKILTYSPEEISEYGLNDGRVYISRSIAINNKEQKIFLERLNKGNINLYFYKDNNGRKFFIERDGGQLIEIFKTGDDNEGYKDILKSYVQDCNNISDALKLVSFNKLSLSKFADQYNSCEYKPFPHIKYGLIIGYSITNITDSKINDEVLKSAAFKNDYAFNIGIYLDVPVLVSYFSFHPEIYYQKNTFTGHYEGSYDIADIVINSNSVTVPVLLRYTHPSTKYRPYIDLGAIYAYHFRNDNTVYSASITNNIVGINEIKNGIYSDNQFGFSLGGGVQYDLDYRKAISLGLRFNNFIGTKNDVYSSNSFQCVIGINL